MLYSVVLSTDANPTYICNIGRRLRGADREQAGGGGRGRGRADRAWMLFCGGGVLGSACIVANVT